MSTQTRPMTAEDLLRFDDPGVRVELVRGELIIMSKPTGEPGAIAMEFGSRLHVHVKANGLGRAFAAETGFLLERNPDTVRGADAAFVGRERLEKIGTLRQLIPLGPDLVVEIASPHDRPGQIAEKLGEWLAAGAQLVWWVYPERREVVEHRPGVAPRTFAEADTLDGGDVVPGFRCRVADLFE